jgi:hypothetical protein
MHAKHHKTRELTQKRNGLAKTQSTSDFTLFYGILALFPSFAAQRSLKNELPCNNSEILVPRGLWTKT